MRGALAVLALGGAAPALAQGPAPVLPLRPSPVSSPVTDRERDAFGSAISRSDLDAVRGVVGRYVLLFTGPMNFNRSSPEALIEATRGCRLVEAARIGNDPAMWYRYACPHRPRGDIPAWEEPGVYIKLWHHPAGVLASFWYPASVEVRPPPRGHLPAPPPTRAPSRRSNP